MTHPNTAIEAAAAQRVRQNAVPAAVAAMLMLYFGFVYLAEPTGSDLFHLAGRVFYYTLRIGGAAMGVLAAWCAVGRPIALLVDAVVSIVIGVLFVLTGVAMGVDGGGLLQSGLNVLFGAMFVSAGARNGRDYFDLMEPARAARDAHSRSFNESPVAEIPPQNTSVSLDLDESTAQASARFDDDGSPPLNGEAEIAPTDLSADGAPEAPSPQDATAENDEPGGFLASFADDEPAPRV